MSLAEVLRITSDIVTILALLVAGVLAIFVFLQFAPVINLRIVPTWPDDGSRWVILRIEVENKSRIRVHKQLIRLQVLQHELREASPLSEWVPFEEKDIIPSEQPIEWHEPIEIFQSTREVDPGEVMTVERLHYCAPNTVLHVGLQVRARLNFFGRVAAQVRGWHQQWTTTRIVMK